MKKKLFFDAGIWLPYCLKLLTQGYACKSALHIFFHSFHMSNYLPGVHIMTCRDNPPLLQELQFLSSK